ncbi:MAG: TlpA family protein disulfide reductase [Treponema sp.]|nr:TlpA family protein disulfide reductase [Treponema sp.]
MRHHILKHILLSVLCITVCTATLSAQKALPKVGDAAPTFTIKLDSGKTVTLADYKGKAVLLHFWATWCPPCRVELPHMDKLAKRLTENNNSKLAFVAVCVSDSEKNRTTFMKKNGYSFDGGLDTLDTIGLNYGITGIPTSVLISPDGKIEAIQVGAMSEGKLTQFISAYDN